MTILDAIKTVMKSHRSPMTAREAYEAIQKRGLYEFRAQNPVQVVSAQLRRHCEGIDLPNSGKAKHFRKAGENRFAPLD